MDKPVSKYALLMDRLAVPLVQALYIQGHGAQEPEEFARKFAAMLSMSVSLGGDMVKRFDLPQETQSDRMAVTVVAGAMLAGAASQNSDLPDQKNQDQILNSFDGFLNFAEEFISDLEEDLGSSKPARTTDVLEYGVPLINAVSEFSFGRDQSAVLNELTLGLRARMKQLMRSLALTDQDVTDRLRILKSGMMLLCESYQLRVAAIQNGATSDADAAIHDIWQQFEQKLDMMKAVLSFIDQGLRGGSSTIAKGSGDSKKVKPLPPQKEEPQQPTADPANPMSFFVKQTG